MFGKDRKGYESPRDGLHFIYGQFLRNCFERIWRTEGEIKRSFMAQIISRTSCGNVVNISRSRGTQQKRPARVKE